MELDVSFILDQGSQVGLAVFTIVAIYLSASSDPRWRMTAGIVGLCGEPFWIATAFMNQQWGIGIVAVFISFGWWRLYSKSKKQMRSRMPLV